MTVPTAALIQNQVFLGIFEILLEKDGGGDVDVAKVARSFERALQVNSFLFAATVMMNTRSRRYGPLRHGADGDTRAEARYLSLLLHSIRLITKPRCDTHIGAHFARSDHEVYTLPPTLCFCRDIDQRLALARHPIVSKH